VNADDPALRLLPKFGRRQTLHEARERHLVAARRELIHHRRVHGTPLPPATLDVEGRDKLLAEGSGDRAELALGKRRADLLGQSLAHAGVAVQPGWTLEIEPVEGRETSGEGRIPFEIGVGQNPSVRALQLVEQGRNLVARKSLEQDIGTAAPQDWVDSSSIIPSTSAARRSAVILGREG